MSALWGFAFLDGRPASRHDLDRMSTLARAWGADRVGVATLGSAAFGHALAATLPEDAATCVPIAEPTREHLIVTAGRLDNRCELERALGIPTGDPPAADTTLMARALERWPAVSPTRLVGDWAFAVWNSRERRLVLGRDHVGRAPLFYWRRFPLVAFASNADWLFQLPGVTRQVDEERLARYLVIRQGRLDRTFYHDVSAVLPGHTVTFSPAGGESVRRFWTIAQAPAIRFRDESDYVNGFLDTFRVAVRARMRTTGRVASTLSSGLDSAAVTALAAESGREVLAYTAVPAHGVELRNARADEGPYAADVAARWPNIVHVRLNSTAVSPIAAAHEALRHYGQPVHGASALFWFLDILRHARTAGAHVLLTGGLGNCGVSWDGGRYRVYYTLRRSPAAGVAELIAVRSVTGRSWRRTLRDEIARPLFHRVVRHRHRLRRPGVSLWEHRGVAPASLLARLAAEGKLQEADDLGTERRHPPESERQLVLELNAAASGPALTAFGAAFQLDVRDPTADVRVLEYCFGVPDEQHARGGIGRLLLRRAMHGRLPDHVRSNTMRGLQGADLGQRLLHFPADVDRAFERVDTPAVSTFVDVPALRALWASLRTTGGTQQPDAVKLLRGMMAAFFVLRVIEPSESAW